MLDAIEGGQDTSVRFFKDWASEVIQAIPRDRLLVYEVREGWDSLCNFLDVPVPVEPFPNINNSDEFRLRISKLKTLAYMVVLGIPSLMAICIGFCHPFFWLVSQCTTLTCVLSTSILDFAKFWFFPPWVLREVERTLTSSDVLKGVLASSYSTTIQG